MAKSFWTTDIEDTIWHLRLTKYLDFAGAILFAVLSAAAFLSALGKLIASVFIWLRTGVAGESWSAFDVLAHIVGPRKWFTDPVDWIGVWKVLDHLGGIPLLFIAGIATAAIAGAGFTKAEDIDKKLKAKRAPE